MLYLTHIPIIAAGVVVDSLGREWDPTLHPRDRKGKFIHTFRLIRAFLTPDGTDAWGTGSVEQINSDGSVRMRVEKVSNPEWNDRVGQLVDVTPDHIENINEKATLNVTSMNAVAAKWDFSSDSMSEFFTNAGITRASDAWSKLKHAEKGGAALSSGKMNQLDSMQKYHLALYAKSISGEGKQHTDSDYMELLETLDVDPNIIDDTPDGMSGLATLADTMNAANAPNPDKPDSIEWWNERVPTHPGVIRELQRRDSDVRIRFYGDGKQTVVWPDGTEEQHDKNAGDILVAGRKAHEAPGTAPGAEPAEIDKPEPVADLTPEPDEVEGPGLPANPAFQDDGTPVPMDGEPDHDIGFTKMWGAAPSNEEREALYDYQGMSFIDVNDALRSGSIEDLGPMARKEIEHIDNVLARSRTSQPMRVYRGMRKGFGPDYEKKWSDFFDGMEVGSTFQDDGFVSTSYSASAAENFMGGVDENAMFHIDVPEGTPALDMNAFKYGQDSETGSKENEILLTRGSKFRVTKMEVVDGVQHVHAAVEFGESDEEDTELPKATLDVPEPEPEPEVTTEPEPEEEEPLLDLGDEEAVVDEEELTFADIEFDRDGIASAAERISNSKSEDAEVHVAAINAVLDSVDEGTITPEEGHTQLTAVANDLYDEAEDIGGEDDHDPELWSIADDLAGATNTILGIEVGDEGEDEEEEPEPYASPIGTPEAAPESDVTDGEDYVKGWTQLTGGPPTAEELEALNIYGGAFGVNMNRYMRGLPNGDGSVGLHPEFMAHLDNLRGLMDRSSLIDSPSVYRGVRPGADGASEKYMSFINSITQEGAIIEDDGFMSVSRSKIVADGFASGMQHMHPNVPTAIVHFNVPEGTRGIDVDAILPDQAIGEKEILLPPGSKIRVSKVSKDANNRYNVEVDLLPEGYEDDREESQDSDTGPGEEAEGTPGAPDVDAGPGEGDTPEEEVEPDGEDWGSVVDDVIAGKITHNTPLEQLGTELDVALGWEDENGLGFRVSSARAANETINDEEVVGVTFTVELVDNDTGDVVGTGTRHVMRDDDGELYVYLSDLSIDEDFQGQGAGSRQLKNMREYFKERGFSRLELFANSTVGGYAWARTGADWGPSVTDDDVLSRIDDIESFIDSSIDDPSLRPKVRAEVQALRDRLAAGDRPSPWDLSKVGEAYPHDWAPAGLLGLTQGVGWQGVFVLNDSKTDAHVGKHEEWTKKHADEVLAVDADKFGDDYSAHHLDISSTPEMKQELTQEVDGVTEDASRVVVIDGPYPGTTGVVTEKFDNGNVQVQLDNGSIVTYKPEWLADVEEEEEAVPDEVESVEEALEDPDTSVEEVDAPVGKFEVLDDPGDSGDGYYPTTDGTKLWGKYGAAGVMVRHVDEDGTERFLMVQRGPIVSTNKGKWQLPGGALNSNENDYQGTARELQEELGPPDDFVGGLTPVGEVNFEHPSGWHYNNIAADAPTQFDPDVDGTETGDAGWFTREEVEALPLHPALANNLDKIFGEFPEREWNPDDTIGESDEIPEATSVSPGATVDASNWSKIGGQGGSNLGGVFEDEDGMQFYVKKSQTGNHARNEALAAKFYKETDVASADQVLVQTPWGGVGTASPLIPDAKADLQNHLNDPEYLRKLQEGFAVDAWLGNWDVAGLVYDNVVTDADGNPVRIDPGGALYYRAQGEPKHSLGDWAWGANVGELESLRNPGINPTSAKVFGSMTDEDIRNSAQRVLDISPERIDEIVDSVGFPDQVGWLSADKMKETLKARRRDLADKLGLTLPEDEPDLEAQVNEDDDQPEDEPLYPGSKYTNSELTSIDEYVSESIAINNALRTGESTPEIDAHIAKIDGAMGRDSIEPGTTRYRGMVFNEGDPIFDKIKPGGVIEDDAYVSTTLSLTAAKNFATADNTGPGKKSVIFVLDTDKSIPAMDIGSMYDDGEEDVDESEWLLPHGTGIAVDSVEEKDGVLYATGRILTPDEVPETAAEVPEEVETPDPVPESAPSDPYNIKPETFDTGKTYQMDFNFALVGLDEEEDEFFWDYLKKNHIIVDDEQDDSSEGDPSYHVMMLRGRGRDLANFWKDIKGKGNFYERLNEVSPSIDTPTPASDSDPWEIPQGDPWGVASPSEPTPDVPEVNEPGPGSTDYAGMVDAEGPYRWSADGKKVRVGMKVTSNKDGLSGTIHKFEKNHDGVVVLGDDNKKRGRKIKTLTVHDLENEPAPEPTPTPTPAPSADPIEEPLQAWEAELLQLDSDLQVGTKHEGSNGDMFEKKADGWYQIATSDGDPVSVPLAPEAGAHVEEAWKSNEALKQAFPDDDASLASDEAIPVGTTYNPTNGSVYEKKADGWYQTQQAGEPVNIKIFPEAAQYIEKSLLEPTDPDDNPTTSPDADPATPAFTDITDIRAGIPKKMHLIKDKYPHLTNHQANQWRNGGFAMDDLMNFTQGTKEWNKAYEKALYNLNQAGPDAANDRGALEIWYDSVTGKSNDKIFEGVPAGWSIPDPSGDGAWVKQTDGTWKHSFYDSVVAKGSTAWQAFENSAPLSGTAPESDKPNNFALPIGYKQPPLGTRAVYKYATPSGTTWYAIVDNNYKTKFHLADGDVTDAPNTTVEALEADPNMVKQVAGDISLLPEGYAQPPMDTLDSIYAYKKNGDPGVTSLYAVVDTKGVVKYYSANGSVIDVPGATKASVAHGPLWELKHTEQNDLQNVPAPAAAPQKTGPSMQGFDGKPIYVGDKVQSTTDGSTGVVTKFESNGTGLVMLMPDGTKKARKAKKLRSLEPTVQGAPPIAKKDPPKKDPSSVWYEKPEPQAPPKLEASDKAYVDDAWMKWADENYKQRMKAKDPNWVEKPLSSSSTYNQFLEVQNGSIKALDDLRVVGRINDEMYDAALTQIHDRTSLVLKRQNEYTVAVDQWRKDRKAWRAANGMPLLELRGMHEGVIKMNDDDISDWMDMHHPAGSLGPGGKMSSAAVDAVGSQKSGNISGDGHHGLRSLREKSLDINEINKLSNSWEIKAMDKAMEESPPAVADFITIRTVSTQAFVNPDTGTYFGGSAHISNIVGTIQHDFGFAETSPGSLEAGATIGYDQTYGGGVVMELRVPAGTRGVWTRTPQSGGQTFGYWSERGYILERGLAYYIHSAEWKNGKWHVKAEIISKTEVSYDEFGQFVNENPFFD